MLKKRIKKVIFLPKEIEDEKLTGYLYGYYIKETDSYNIVKIKDTQENFLIGKIYPNKDNLESFSNDNFLVGYWDNNKLHFHFNQEKIEKKPYELTQNIFSRNSGILETKKMLEKSVIISGCGSVGSLVALELARSGVGNFLLVDNDILEYHNICRHQCSIKDVGKYKVDAVKERILDINPLANVITQSKVLERIEKRTFDTFSQNETIIVGCADNREGDLYANKISYLFNVPLVSIGFWERAFAGEIFYSIPNKTPCYECQFGSFIDSKEDTRRNQNHRFYVDMQELEEISFEPGISIDINFVTTVGIKLIIDILNRNEKDYFFKVYNYLTQYTLICNTNNPRIGGELADIFSFPLQVTNSIIVEKKENCSICSKEERNE